MKITHIDIHNFLGLRQFKAALAPLTLIAGPNGAGKSSLADAIRFALLGTMPRGLPSQKRAYAQLLHRGQAFADVRVRTEEDTFRVQIDGGGEVEDSHQGGGDSHQGALPCLLDMHRFSAMKPDERRTTLFRSAGLSAGIDAVRERLAARGCDMERAESLLPLLRTGYPTAEAEAKIRAREAKAAWRTLTGATWGEKIAASWRPEAPTSAEADLDTLRQQEAAAEAETADAQRRVGEMKAKRGEHARLSEHLERMRPTAHGFAALEEEAQVLRKDLAAAQQALTETEAALHAARPEDHNALTCPWCYQHSSFDGRQLVRYEPPEGEPASAAQRQALAQKVDALRVKIGKKTQALRDKEAQVTAADLAARQLAEIEDALEAEPAPDDAALAEAEAAAAAAKGREASIRQAIAWQAERLAADEKTRQALDLHHDAMHWLALADAFGPSGIPAEILRDAIAPFNARLQAHAQRAGWPTPRLDDEMTIWIGPQPLALASESERWRADAMLTAALAEISGLRVMVLDRLDVLDLKGRGQALGWLYGLRDEVQTVALATLKAPPSERQGLAVYWIEHGNVCSEAEAA